MSGSQRENSVELYYDEYGVLEVQTVVTAFSSYPLANAAGLNSPTVTSIRMLAVCKWYVCMFIDCM